VMRCQRASRAIDGLTNVRNKEMREYGAFRVVERVHICGNGRRKFLEVFRKEEGLNAMR
jgi:hypothetical protein